MNPLSGQHNVRPKADEGLRTRDRFDTTNIESEKRAMTFARKPHAPTQLSIPQPIPMVPEHSFDRDRFTPRAKTTASGEVATFAMAESSASIPNITMAFKPLRELLMSENTTRQYATPGDSDAPPYAPRGSMDNRLGKMTAFPPSAAIRETPNVVRRPSFSQQTQAGLSVDSESGKFPARPNFANKPEPEPKNHVLCRHVTENECECSPAWSEWALGYESVLDGINRHMVIKLTDYARTTFKRDTRRELFICSNVTKKSGCRPQSCPLRHFAPEPGERLWMKEDYLSTMDTWPGWEPAPGHDMYWRQPRLLRNGKWCWAKNDIRDEAPKNTVVLKDLVKLRWPKSKEKSLVKRLN